MYRLNHTDNSITITKKNGEHLETVKGFSCVMGDGRSLKHRKIDFLGFILTLSQGQYVYNDFKTLKIQRISYNNYLVPVDKVVQKEGGKIWQSEKVEDCYEFVKKDIETLITKIAMNKTSNYKTPKVYNEFDEG